MRRAWFRSLTRWMDRVRPQVLPADGPPAPQALGGHTVYWGQLMDSEVVPVASGLLARVRNRLTGAPEDEAVTDQEAAAYLNEAGNRLRRVPDEVYSLVVREIETGLARSEGIPEISARVRTVLTASGSEYWPNRAVVVARTEVQGAVQAGAYFGALEAARERGDLAPRKMWISTRDERTRPAHRAADGQSTLIAEPFVVGGARLQFPGDPRGPAATVIQCRCSAAYLVDGERLDWTNRQMERS